MGMVIVLLILISRDCVHMQFFYEEFWESDACLINMQVLTLQYKIPMFLFKTVFWDECIENKSYENVS